MLPIHETKSSKMTQNVFLAIGGLHEDKLRDTLPAMSPTNVHYRRYFQHAHVISIERVRKRDAYQLSHGDLPRQHPFGITLRFTGPVLADSQQ